MMPGNKVAMRGAFAASSKTLTGDLLFSRLGVSDGSSDHVKGGSYLATKDTTGGGAAGTHFCMGAGAIARDSNIVLNPMKIRRPPMV